MKAKVEFGTIYATKQSFELKQSLDDVNLSG